MQILRIDSASTGANSISRQVTQALTDHFTAKYPNATLVTRDLVADPLPHIDDARTGAIRQPEDTHTPAMKSVFAEERAVLDEFLASDIVIVGAPMYNFTIPSQLKSWIDRLGVPRLTFRYGENGVEGLAGGRKVVIASSRGGSYELGGTAEHQETLLRDFFGFIGVTDLHFVTVNNAGFGPEAVEQGLASAKEQIAEL
ncbi:MAG: FMN-dependent NADH-azoreductase [Tsuneonella suprasediminis]|uniref:FMN dependent NADH:quinone oxidoreductase n=1 Tax=Tsuneonella suprasediminis TaxID=2306996 RepID=A0A419QZW9_9SPHN|nr:NAD(P)H-dependent oxidoreductase [Tsuneonella suprasediminis]RJX66736.1 FMN-dependent NADH-azoreductase [Tsuneonella suprasediminis]UBS32478.1 NAD(P)H-dependent oxidoreductase [Altererythrobacter sp. N1]